MLPKKMGWLRVYSENLVTPGFDFRNFRIGYIVPMGKPPYGYFWDGEAIVTIGSRALDLLGIEPLEIGQVVDIGPYRVRVMDRWARADAYIVIRESRTAAIRVTLHRAQLWCGYNIAGPLYRRGVKRGWITVGDHTAIWRDVKAVDWIAGKLGR